MTERPRYLVVLLATSALWLPTQTVAQVVAADGATKVYNAPNGVPVVDIATPNGAGVSHNRFTDYNVDSRGLVLNNGTSDQMQRQSQLAGRVTSNLNLDRAATVILNEVVAPNRSLLAGFTEVLGSAAEVVVANPFGITCEGCGFINTPNVTLTTGTPIFAGDSLTGFSVTRGDIRIGGAGLNATGQDYLALVTRKILINGQVNARQLDIVAGANRWDRATRSATAIAPGDAAPDYAIDSTLLGGLYANRIRFIATEAGVGVRSLGSVAATAGDFTIDAAGHVAIGGTLSTTGDVRLAGASLALDRAQITAGRDLVAGAGGSAVLTGGTLSAGRDLTLAAAQLTDSGGVRHASTNLGATVTGAATLANTRYSAGGSLAVNAGSLAAAGGSLSGNRLDLAAGGDLALGTASVRSAGDLTLRAGGAVSTAAGTGQIVETTSGSVRIAAGAVANGGTIAADAGALGVQADGAITNSGTLRTAGELTLGGRNAAAAASIANSGSVLARGAIVATAGGVANSGTAQSNQTIALTVDTLDNSGTVQAGSSLTAMIADSARNSGTLMAAGDLSLGVTAATTAALANVGDGLIQAGGTLAIDAGEAGTLDIEGGRLLGSRITLDTGALTNNGTVQSAGDLTAHVGGTLTNRGTLLAGGQSDLGAIALINEQTIQAAVGTSLDVDTLTNRGTITLSTTAGASDAIAARIIANEATGTLQSAGTLDLALWESVDNAGKLIAGGGLGIRGETGATLSVINRAGATLQAGGTLEVTGAGASIVQDGTLLGRRVTIAVADVDNGGTTQADEDLDLAATDSFTNDGTLIAKDELAIDAQTVSNSGTLQATNGSTLAAGTLDNGGTLIGSEAAGGSTQLTVNQLVNRGTLQSAGTLQLAARDSVDNIGKLLAGGDLGLHASDAAIRLSFANRAGAIVQAGSLLSIGGAGGATNLDFTVQAGTLLGGSLNLAGGSLINAGTVQSNGDATLRLSGNLTNTGILLTDDALTLIAGAIVNNAGARLQSGGTTLTGTSLANQGTLIASTDAGRAADITVGTMSNGSIVQAAGDLSLIGSTNLANSGKLLAGGDLTVRASGTGGTFAISNAAGAVIQAGDLLDIATGPGQALSFASQAGTLNGGRLNLVLASLNNVGLVQSQGATRVEITGLLTNSSAGRMLLGVGGPSTSSELLADRIDNRGLLQATGDLTIRLGDRLDNAAGATLLAGGDLGIVGTRSSYRVENSGVIEAVDRLSLAGRNASERGEATVEIGAILRGGSVDLDLTRLTLAGNSDVMIDGGGLISAGDLSLRADTLKLAGINSYVVGAAGGSGQATLTLATIFDNPGLVYSGQNLTITAPRFRNRADAGLAASGVLTLTSASSDLLNEGSIYAGSAVNLTAGGTLTNAESGSIDSDGNATFVAGTFLNNNNVMIEGDLTITATVFRNEIVGGDNRHWSYEGSGFYPYEQGGDQDNRTDANEEDHSDVLGWDSDNYDTNHENGDTTWWWRADFHVEQYYAGGKKTDKPQLLSNRNLTIREFQTAINLGGIISAPTVNISSTRGGASFVNESMAIIRKNWRAEWNHYENCTIIGTDCDYNDYRSYDKWVTGTTTIDSIGAGIFAGTLNASGFALTNSGSPYTATASSTGKNVGGGSTLTGGSTAATGTGGIGGISATTGASGVSGITAVPGAPAIVGVTTAEGKPAVSFSGVVIPLPTGPNSLFVPARNPEASFLVESNPRFTTGAAGVGSDFMAERLGFNPDDLQRRLGDARYESYLITQQVISQTGAATLVRGETTQQQVQRLMEQGVAQAGDLGLTWGKALTPEQAAKLGQDMVWMVETEVAGQKVLAPVVYLSAATKTMFEQGGAVIAADNATLKVDSLNNNGGTIEGSKTLTVTSKGDITNTSGTIKGGDVSLTSTEGSIVNQTLAETTGDKGGQATVIGKTGGIEATGNLNLDAARDITVTGAQVSAGGNATLNAGGDITFGAIDDRNSSTDRNGNSTTTTTTVNQIGSSLNVGGNLELKSGGDTTFKASSAEIGGNASVTTGGDFNVIAGQNSTETTSTSSRSGVGVGGGVYGTETTTTYDFQGRNAGSTFSVGGNLDVDAQGAMTIQGSEVNVGGNADIKADAVRVLQGNDVDISTTTTTTTTYLRTGAGSESGASTNAGASAGTQGAIAEASASAGAGAENRSTADLELMNQTTTTTHSESSRAVGSSLNIGGNASIQANKDVTLQGSTVSAGGNVDIKAQDVNVLAAENREVTTTTTTSTSVGFMTESNNSAQAGAAADASASLTVQANAEASASAESDNTVDLVRHSTTTTTTTDITHTGSAITAGGNLGIKADNELKVQGSSLEAGGNVDLQADTMKFEAVNDVHETTTTTSETRAGLFVSGGAEAKAGAEVGVTGASAGASAEAEAGAGLQASHSTSSSTEGSTTAVTSSIKAGGNINRTADGKITDVGTQIEAGGNFSQSAAEWESKAAQDTTYSSQQSQTDSGRIGAYADAEAGASAGAGLAGGSGADAGASVGGKISYSHEDASSSQSSSTAVTSTIKTGGSFSSTTSGATSLEGTNVQAGGDASLTAGSLDYKAAQNTQTSSSSSTTGEASAKVGVDVTKAVKVELEGAYSGSEEQSSSSQAVTGGISSGGNLSIKTTTGDANFEGTKLDAVGSGSISSAGSVNFEAARDTSSSSSSSSNVSAGVSTSRSKSGSTGGVSLEGGYEQSTSSSSQAVTGSFTTGKGMSVEAGGNATFEGTKLEAGGDASISAGGDVNFNAAKSTSSSQSFGVQAGIGAETTKSGSTGSAGTGGAGNTGAAGTNGNKAGDNGSSSSGGVSLSGEYRSTSETTYQGGGVTASGKVSVSAGGDVVKQNATVSGGGGTSVEAGGTVRTDNKSDSRSEIGVKGSLKGETTSANAAADTTDTGSSTTPMP